MEGVLAALTLVGALGSGLIAGVCFAFSSFVMPALARLEAAAAVAAMQAINVAAISFAFMLALFGTGAVAVALAAWAVADWDGAFSPHLLIGSVLYLAGVIGMTMAFHVPRNDALASVDAESPEDWSRYHASWTAGNHVRAAAALGAAAALTLALQAG